MARGWDRLKSWCYYLRYPLLMGLAIIADRLFILWPYFDGRYRSLAMKEACLDVYYETLWWLSHVLSTSVVVLLFLVSLISAIMALKYYWNYSEKKYWRAQIIQDVQGQSASIINGVINEELAKVREIAKQDWGEIRSAKAEITRDRNQVDQWRNNLKAREIAVNMTCQRLGLQLPEFEPLPELKVDPEPPANFLFAVEPAPTSEKPDLTGAEPNHPAAESNPPAVETTASNNQGDEVAANLECPVDPADQPQYDQASLPAADMPTDDQAAMPESKDRATGPQELEVVTQPKPHHIKTATEDSPSGGVVVRLGHGGDGRFHEGILAAPSRGSDEEKEALDEDEENDPGPLDKGFEDDPIIQALIQFMEGRDQWEGMASELVELLKINPELKTTLANAPHVLTRKINKTADYLMAHGISYYRDRSNRQRSFALKRLDADFNRPK